MPPLNFPKPTSFWWAFLFLLFSSVSRADFYQEQIEPVKERAFDSQSQALLLSGFGSTWLASTQDNQIRDQYRDHQTISPQASRLGDQFGTYLVGPAIAVGQIYFDHDNGISHARGLVYTTLVTHLLKESVRRERPDSSNRQSMPSGHSSSAFATATSLTYAYGWKAGVVVYPVATFVALSRVADDVHWFSDVVAGAFIGAWMGRASFYSTKDFYKHKNSYKGFEYQFVPILTSETAGLSLEASF